MQYDYRFFFFKLLFSVVVTNIMDKFIACLFTAIFFVVVVTLRVFLSNISEMSTLAALHTEKYLFYMIAIFFHIKDKTFHFLHMLLLMMTKYYFFLSKDFFVELSKY